MLQNKYSEIVKSLLFDVSIGVDSNIIKDKIVSLPLKIKGPCFELFIAEMYKGNGWLATCMGQKDDLGADILLFHPQDPTSAKFIIQVKNHNRPLSYDATKSELQKFEERASKKYNCNQFKIISIGGYVASAMSLCRFNMVLDNWSVLESLIKNYGKEKTSAPRIDLYAHNLIAMENIKELQVKSKRIAVVQATGTGKSYLIASVMAQHYSEPRLLVAPSNYILEQFENSFPWLKSNLKTMTYAGLMQVMKDKVDLGRYPLIVLDEFHRAGADLWGMGIDKLLEVNLDSLIIGTSATPIRHLDNSRNIADEMFGGHIAANLSLADAICQKILPMPKYVSSLYTLAEDTSDLEQKIKTSNLEESEKKLVNKKLKRHIVDWEKTHGVPELLKKYLTDSMKKFIIFCRDKDHLIDMETEVDKWFKDANRNLKRERYRIASGEVGNSLVLQKFKEAKNDKSFHLLFCIDMLNEGLHISDVDGVLLLRQTESPTIFYQQIGRCIQSGANKTPIIFDLVNNFKSIRANDFKKDLTFSKEKEDQIRKSLGLASSDIQITIIDETQELFSLFNEIENRLSSWEVKFLELELFNQKEGHCLVPTKYEENPSLGTWVSRQRNFKELLKPEQVHKLNELGFVWDAIDNAWEEMFALLVTFKKHEGHCKVPSTYHVNPKLRAWVDKLRGGRNNISPERKKRLDDLGFDWNPYSSAWEMRFKELEEFNKIFGHCNVSSVDIEYLNLGRWVSDQREQQDNLSLERKNKLSNLGFVWNRFDFKWEKMFIEFKEFVEREGHALVPQIYQPNPTLGIWVANNRATQNSLDIERKKRLDDLGFSWNPNENAWEEKFKELVDFKKLNGHCNAPKRNSLNNSLGSWVLSLRKKKEKLNSDQIKKLDALEFDWDPKRSTWESKFLELVEYKNKYGDCNVPNRYKLNRPLGSWVAGQRNKKEPLTEDQVKQLDEIGFDWDPVANAWEKSFQKLIFFKKFKGHCNAPELVSWIGTLRKKKEFLTKDQIKRLDEIGFDWDPLASLWNQMIFELKDFKKRHGHCNVPYSFKENPSLGMWVGTQRKKKDKLSQERIKKLDAIGFCWKFK